MLFEGYGNEQNSLFQVITAFIMAMLIFLVAEPSGLELIYESVSNMSGRGGVFWLGSRQSGVEVQWRGLRNCHCIARIT